MDVVEGARLPHMWLEIAVHDGHAIKSRLAREGMRDLAVCAGLFETLLARFRVVVAVLEKLQERIPHAPELYEPLQDLAFMAWFQREFNQCAADLGIEINILNQSEAYWRDQVNAASQALQDEIEERVLQLFEDSADPDVRRKVVWTLAFEIQCCHGRGVFDSSIDVVRNVMVPALTAERLLVTERETKELARIKKLAHEREIQVWQDLNHPHILQFYGATSFGADCSIVSELASKGKLYDYWLNPVDPLLKAQMWRLLFEASLGVQYMHSKGFVHGDLKCDNIFVGDDWRAKVADFGLSFRIGQHKDVPCTEAANWLAPECMDKEAEVRARTFATDVFMFGMCIVEAVSGGVPWGGMGKGSIRYQLFTKKALPETIARFAPDVQELVSAMCKFEPSERIGMDEVVKRLKLLDEARNPRHLEVRPHALAI
ncbi:Leucine-rich repeat serine/threonine-protein kinase 2 [Globisporangium polare]